MVKALSIIKNQRGQALLEFSLVLPILLLLISGIIDFGRISYTYMNLQLTTQESVRLGGLGEGDNEIREFAKDHFTAGDSESLVVNISPSQLDRKSGDYVTVTLEYPVEYITPMVSRILPSPFQVVASSTIRVE
jgi:Flp pilus assembly protein TadG